MSKNSFVFYILGVIIIISPSPTTTLALPIGEAVQAIADRLVSEQIQEAPDLGIWPEEADFTGSIVAGMVDAYELTSNSTYKTSAELGGDYIFSSGKHILVAILLLIGARPNPGAALSSFQVPADRLLQPFWPHSPSYGSLRHIFCHFRPSAS